MAPHSDVCAPTPVPTAAPSSEQTKATPVSKTRLAWVDIAKGIAIILVVTGHSLSDGSQLIPMIFMFHMPLFFIMAGYTSRPKPMKEVLKNSFNRLFIPYILIFIVYQGINWIQRPELFSWESAQELFLRFIFASGSRNVDMGIEMVGMEWFLMCLFVSRLALNALLLFFEQKSTSLPLQGLTFAVMAALGIFIGDYLNLYLPLDIDLALVTTGFMWCGYAAKKIDFMQKWGKRWYVLLGALFVFALAYKFGYLELAVRIFYMPVLCILGALSGSLLTCWISTLIEKHTKLLKKFLSFMGRNSMLIYCFHCLDWYVPSQNITSFQYHYGVSFIDENFMPWRNIAIIENLPFQSFFITIIRLGYDTLMTLLVKKAQS